MNLSGEAVRDAALISTRSRRSTLSLSDDVSLDGNAARARKRLGRRTERPENIIYHLNSEDFLRVKIGVGKSRVRIMIWRRGCFGKFPAEDQKAIDKACEDAVNAAACIIAGGLCRRRTEIQRKTHLRSWF